MIFGILLIKKARMAALLTNSNLSSFMPMWMRSCPLKKKITL